MIPRRIRSQRAPRGWLYTVPPRCATWALDGTLARPRLDSRTHAATHLGVPARFESGPSELGHVRAPRSFGPQLPMDGRTSPGGAAGPPRSSRAPRRARESVEPRRTRRAPAEPGPVRFPLDVGAAGRAGRIDPTDTGLPAFADPYAGPDLADLAPRHPCSIWTVERPSTLGGLSGRNRATHVARDT